MGAKDTVKLYTEDIVKELIKEGRKTGIREVVEWIENKTKSHLNEATPNAIVICMVSIASDEWQAKLKEWGL